MIKQVQTFFERRTDARDLILLNVLFCGLALIQTLYSFPEEIRYLLRALPSRSPLWVFGKIPIPAVSLTVAVGGGVVFLIALFLSMVGVRVKASLWLAFFSYFALFPNIMGLWYIGRMTNLMPLVLLILATAPGIDKCGLKDLLLLWRLDENSAPRLPYWPIFLVQLVLCGSYLSAGCTKLLNNGYQWADGTTLQSVFYWHYLAFDSPLAWWLAHQAWLCKILMWTSLGWELTFVSVLVFPRLSPIYALFGLSFHWVNYVVLKIGYLRYFCLPYVAFLNWKRFIAFFPSSRLKEAQS